MGLDQTISMRSNEHAMTFDFRNFYELDQAVRQVCAETANSFLAEYDYLDEYAVNVKLDGSRIHLIMGNLTDSSLALSVSAFSCTKYFRAGWVLQMALGKLLEGWTVYYDADS